MALAKITYISYPRVRYDKTLFMKQNNTIDDDEIDLAELFYALWAHKFFIGICTALAIFCAGYYALTTDKEYTAQAVFEIQQAIMVEVLACPVI